MAKGLYIGTTENVSKKCKKIYVGINDTAKKVKKIYIGDSSNIAKLAYSGSNPRFQYYTSGLSTRNRYDISATNLNGKYIIISPGNGDDNTSGYIFDIFDENFTTQYLDPYQGEYAARTACAKRTSKYAIFTGYMNDNRKVYISSSLTRTNNSNDHAHESTTVCGTFGGTLFAGGKIGGSDSISDVELISDGLTKTILPSLPISVYAAGSGRNSKYAIIAGGYHSQNSHSYITDRTVAYNSSNTQVSSPNLSDAYFGGEFDRFRSIEVGDKVGFIVGSSMDIYDSSLTKGSISLPYDMGKFCNTAVCNGLGLILYKNLAFQLDKSLTLSQTDSMPTEKNYGATVSINDNILIFCGCYNYNYTKSMTNDAYIYKYSE